VQLTAGRAYSILLGGYSSSDFGHATLTIIAPTLSPTRAPTLAGETLAPTRVRTGRASLLIPHVVLWVFQVSTRPVLICSTPTKTQQGPATCADPRQIVVGNNIFTNAQNGQLLNVTGSPCIFGGSREWMFHVSPGNNDHTSLRSAEVVGYIFA
jgi:hypothetical protein